ncbi:Lrp/AsnC family transcriptional regulator [Leucothrix pacifica]|uniref:AsnC family transcriptional regulator n=1 Tax=Leucothrix pacifica TaxID=1247513 RepID=A0A317CTX5_9GAMM|nr:Lrp/AsnC family transcriptional regulator [Leucothrix pacifica]PWQ99910.1 AsnC family transcriptional regulator [Leucothrix pacifica]
MKTNTNIDSFDLKILRELQSDGSLTNQELADRVGLTAAPCSRRVKQLEESGVIAERVVRIDERKINLNMIVLLYISMDKHIPERFEAFEETVKNIPEVMECYMITGNSADYQLKVAVPDLENYYEILLGKITRIEGVTGVHSSFILRKIIDSTALPLGYINQ